MPLLIILWSIRICGALQYADECHYRDVSGNPACVRHCNIKSLLIFNLPFTFVKGMIDTAVCFAVYKRISPIKKKYGIITEIGLSP